MRDEAHALPHWTDLNCTVDGCTDRQFRRRDGLCVKHYGRVRDRGTFDLPPPHEWHPTPARAGYIAGIIDGEGTVTLRSWRHHWSVKSGIHPGPQAKPRVVYASALVKITNTALDMLERIKRDFGRGAMSQCWQPAGSHYRPTWDFEVSGHMAVAFLRPLLQYLEIKRAQADLVIECQSLAIAERAMSAHGGRLVEAIRRLNQRGHR